MLEVDLRLSAEQALLECRRRGLVIRNERELAGRAGSHHWHLGAPGRSGTLELNEWQDRVWVNVHPLRDGGWVEALAQELGGLGASVSVLEAAAGRISSWEERHGVFYGLRDPVVKCALFVLAVAAAVLLFLVLRGPDRRAFTFGPSIPWPDVGSAAVLTGVPSWWGGSPRAVALEVDRIAASNPTLGQLVRLGHGERLGNPGGSRVRGKGTAWVGYKLKRPVAVNADLPYIARGCGASPYASGLAHLQATGVTALWVIIDLRRQEVVQISTNARQGRVSPVAGKPYPTCNENYSG